MKIFTSWQCPEIKPTKKILKYACNFMEFMVL